MAKQIDEIQKGIFDYINSPQNKIHSKVRKKELNREKFLHEIEIRALKDGASEYQAKDIVLLVDKALWGFGILDALVNEDDDVSDIRLMSENQVRVKRLGKREATDIRFDSKEAYMQYIEFITNRNNTNISVVNAAQVFTDKDSSPKNILRFSLVSDLLNSSERPTLLIRKISKKKKDFDFLLNVGYLTKAQYRYLTQKWKEGHGILVCGGNGSGKTTFINALLEETPHTRSVVVEQESEELFINEDSHPEMVFRKVIPKKNNSSVEYSLKDLGRLSLMESFDIVVVGEIKGGEAADLCYATYTGAQCMTSVHSNSAREAYEKIIDYALEEYPTRTREDFAKQLSSLDVAVFIEDFKIKEIVELERYDYDTGKYLFKDAEIPEIEEKDGEDA